MASAPAQNEFNLIPTPSSRPAGRPTLEQMRAKLATSRPESAAAPKPQPHKPQAKANHTWVWLLIIGALLVSANFLMYIKKERLMDSLGFQRLLQPLAPPAGIAEEDKALFWAYAAYAPDRLAERFHTPPDALVDAEDAEHHLAGLLAKEVTPAIRMEISALEKARGGAQ